MIVYLGETAITLDFDLTDDITGATCLVKYKKPNGYIGSWTGTITDAANGIYEYDIQAGDIDVKGIWKYWAYVTFSDGEVGIGRPRKLEVRDEGDC